MKKSPKRIAYDKEWRLKNKTKLASIDRRFRENNVEHVKIKQVERRLKHLYDLSVEQYGAMLSDQQGCCKICKTEASSFVKRLHVDHCHETGKIRGLLCSNCNRALGLFKDQVELLKTAIQYLNNESVVQRALKLKEKLK